MLCAQALGFTSIFFYFTGLSLTPHLPVRTVSVSRWDFGFPLLLFFCFLSPPSPMQPAFIRLSVNPFLRLGTRAPLAEPYRYPSHLDFLQCSGRERESGWDEIGRVVPSDSAVPDSAVPDSAACPPACGEAAPNECRAQGKRKREAGPLSRKFRARGVTPWTVHVAAHQTCPRPHGTA